MPLPTYEEFIEPILRVLSEKSEGMRAAEVHDAAAKRLNLTEEQLRTLLNSGQPMYRNRAGWAYDRIKRAGFADTSQRGIWRLNPKGLAYVKEHPNPLDIEEAKKLGAEYLNVPLGHLLSNGQDESVAKRVEISQKEVESSQSPDEQLEQAWNKIRDATALSLLDYLSQVTPARFELIVLDVLHALGYGASREDLKHIGGVQDGGVDGVISLDKLGLEKVYIQAKRWKDKVGSAELQAFYGAVAGQKAKRGVIITTSDYTSAAVNFGNSVEGIVMVNGRQLVDLMMDYDVGVTSRSLKIPRIDTDYFDES